MQSKAKKLIEMIQTTSVEWKPLGEVASYIRGLTYNKGDESPNNSGYKVLRANNITLSNNLLNFDDVKIVKFETAVKPHQKLYSGDILISAASGSREHVGKVAFIKSDLDYYFGGFMGVVRCKEGLNPRYLFHVLTSGFFQAYLSNVLNSSTINNLNSKVMNAFVIPIPPLEIQQKIVKILDKFTELEATLEATLEAELALRKRQYQYYRDFLLDFDNQIGGGIADDYKDRLKDVVWKTLGGVTLPTENIKWKYTDKIYQYIDLTSVSRENKTITDTIAISVNNAPSRAQKIVKEHDVIFATTRPTLQRFTIISKKFSGEIASTGYCVLRANCKEVLPKWIYYQISTERFNQYVEVNQSGSAYPAISDAKVKEFKIPIPPLPEQEKIVAILDKFDTLTHSISEGLPHEIALRRKQYEYYREQLLAFPKTA